MVNLNNQKILTLKSLDILEMVKKKPKEPDMIVDRIIPRTTIIIVSGPGGASKSYLTTQLALSLPTEKVFLRKYPSPKRRRVLIVNGEDEPNELHRRIHHIAQKQIEDLSPEEKEEYFKKLKKLKILPTIDIPNFLIYSTNLETFSSDKIIKFCEKNFKKPVDLIIIDNLTVFHDAEHNSADTATGFMRELKKIQQCTGATVLLVAHVTKSSQEGTLEQRLNASGISGSAAFVNNARHVICMTPVLAKDNIDFGEGINCNDVVALRVSKSNTGKISRDIHFFLRDENGVLSAIELINADPRKRIVSLIEIVIRYPDANKTQLVSSLMKECRMSKSAAYNLIDDHETQQYVEQRETGRNNGKRFVVTSKGEELYAEMTQPEEKTSDESDTEEEMDEAA
jgi:predicted transcriptional regulator/archaellum biogenesis ATPase FlaH